VDTRSKILSFQEAIQLRGQPLILVAGYFDVLRPAHIRDLENARRDMAAAKLLVAVLPRAGEWMSQSARAKMAAALRVIDYVVIAGKGDVEGLIERLRPDRVVRLEAAEERRDKEFSEQARARAKI
jgi:glycerol-3-phosphate cytidylyltransferase-like family protein